MTLDDYLQTASLLHLNGPMPIVVRNPLSQVICADGARLSVQAGEGLYSTPRDNDGPWTHVEVGYPNPPPNQDLWGQYSEDAGGGGVYAYVPIELVVYYIAAHGGTEFK
ncbi:MAG: hypothetical protein M3Q39_01720 [Actinomycetota bacterium]|nr:hypothetical protein [Actinomycetota bacterium]